MGAEIGATTSLFPYDDAMARYLKATGREAIADAADAVAGRPAGRRRGGRRSRPLLRPGHRDRPVRRSSRMINGPHTPDLAHPVSEVGGHATRGGLAARDLVRARSARARTRPTRTSPGPRRSPARRRPTACTAKTAAADHARLRAGAGHHRARRPARRPRGHRRHRAGQRLRAVHRPVGPRRRRPPASQHDRQHLQPQLPEAQRRQRQHARLRDLARDGGGAARWPARSTSTRSPTRSRRPTASRCGSTPPVGEELPAPGFDPGEAGFVAPPADGIVGRRSRWSTRQRPAAAARAVRRRGTARTTSSLPVLMKAKGKCTTDHISAAGPWLQVPGPPREHLRQPVPRRRQRLHRRRVRGRPGQGPARRRGPNRTPTSPSHCTPRASAWCAIGDENYGEGSSREHAAMEPRFRGGKVDLRPQLRPHPRDQPQEAGHAGADLRRSGDLRRDRRGRHDLRARPRRPRARRAGTVLRSTSPTAPRSSSRPPTR